MADQRVQGALVLIGSTVGAVSLQAAPSGSVYTIQMPGSPPAPSSILAVANLQGNTVVMGWTPSINPAGNGNLVFATPNGAPGPAVLRSLVAADIPVLAYLPSGTVLPANTPAVPHQFLTAYTAGSGFFTLAALTAPDIPNIAESQVINLVSDLAAKAPLFSPVFSGTIAIGTGVSLTITGSGSVTASQLWNVVVSSTPPSTGQVLTATSSAAANWQTPAGGGSGAPTGTFHGFANNGLILNTTNNNIFGWSLSQIGGSFVNFNSNASVSAPASYRLQASGSYAYLGEFTGSALTIFPNTASFAQWQTYLALQTVSSIRVWTGLCNTFAGTLQATNPTATALAAFRFDNSGPGPDTHWMAYVGTGAGTFTAVDTGVVPDVNWHQFKIVMNNLGSLLYYIDGILVATILSSATGFPTSPMNDFVQVDSTGTAGILINSMAWYSVY